MFAVSFWVRRYTFSVRDIIIVLQAYDASKKLITALTPNRRDPNLTTAEITAAGFLSAIPTTLVSAPVERAKVVLQTQGQGASGEQKYKGVLDVVKGLYKEGGVRSIFRGSGATLIRDGPGSAMYVCNCLAHAALWC